MEYVIGLDLGTTGLKAVLFDGTGEVIKTSSRPAALSTPAPGEAEQNPEAWYEWSCDLLREVTEDIDRSAVRGVGLSSQGISFVPVDQDNRPLRAALSWLDMRAEAETKELGRLMPEDEWFRRTGKPLRAAYTLPKLLWMRKHEPEIFQNADAFLMPMDYFLARATGNRCTDPTMAGGTMLFDLETRAWSPEIAAMTGMDIRKLPAVLPTGSQAGILNTETQRRTGLSPIPAAVGAQDQKIAAYGANLRYGEATLSLGTAGATEVLSHVRGGDLPTFLYADGEQYCFEGCVDTAGAAIRWAKDILLPGGSYDEWNALASEGKPGCAGVRFIPRLADGGGWENLTLAAARGDLARAVYEGIAREVHALLSRSVSAGAEISALRVFGGGAQSELLCEILASACAVPVKALLFPEMAALGAAKSAAKCAGMDISRFGENQPVREYGGKYILDFRRK